MAKLIVPVCATLGPEQFPLVEHAFLVATSELELRGDIDEETSTELGEQIILEAMRRLARGLPLRTRMDAEVVAAIVIDDLLGSDFDAHYPSPHRHIP